MLVLIVLILWRRPHALLHDNNTLLLIIHITLPPLEYACHVVQIYNTYIQV